MREPNTHAAPCVYCRALRDGWLTSGNHDYLYMTSQTEDEITAYACLLCLTNLSYGKSQDRWTIY
jgi:hypothetical protein